MRLYNRFSNENLCIEYLEKARWGGTPTCARCGCVDIKRHPTQKHQWYCRGCQKNFNVKIGTMFHKTKVELKYWFMVITQMLLIKKGVSSHSIARMINVAVNTAWRMTNKIREAIGKNVFMKNLQELLNVMRLILVGFLNGVRINLMRTVNGKE